jgi:CheY-like chemotaxis protein
MSASPKPSSASKAESARYGKAGTEVLNQLLDKLDALDAGDFRNRRSSARCVYRKTDVPVRIHHPGGSTSFKAVASRNLSATGLGFLYTSFLHNGTRVEVVLKRRLGGEDTIVGKVVFCAHVAGVFHQIGVKFGEKIFPKLYLDPGSYDEVDGEAPVDAARLSGRVLYVDDQEMDRILMKHHLKPTKIEFVGVPGEKEALAEIAKGRFDVVLCDLNLETGPGEQVVKAIRNAGYNGPICMVTAETSQARLRAAQEAGAAGVLGKPYEQAKLIALLAGWLGSTNKEEQIVSTLSGQTDSVDMLEKYVASVHEQIKEIQASAEQEQLEKLRVHCMNLKGSGSGYGFAVLSEAAKEAVKSLDATMSAAESAVQIQRLLDICRRLVAKP